MKILTETLDRLKIGPAQTFAGLTLYPLIGPEASSPACRTLDEALDAGVARVTEVSEGGHVSELSFVNDGDRPVLLLDGEGLVGAKQNRVLNLTVLAPAGKAIVIPVSCVEAGRWTAVSDEFGPAEHVMFSSGRGRKVSAVSCSLRSEARAISDQVEVWNDVDEMARLCQVGAVFVLGGRLRGVELFDHPKTLRSLLPKLVRSWALDAIHNAKPSHEVPPPEAVRAWLGDIATAKTTTHEAAGLGQDVRLTGERLAGGALVYEERVVHLCAFKLNDADGQGVDSVPCRIISASRRARRRS